MLINSQLLNRVIGKLVGAVVGAVVGTVVGAVVGSVGAGVGVVVGSVGAGVGVVVGTVGTVVGARKDITFALVKKYTVWSVNDGPSGNSPGSSGGRFPEFLFVKNLGIQFS